jgi:hypothetical protein
VYQAHFGDGWTVTGTWKILWISALWEGRLVWAWNFDSISGNQVTDISWNSNNGTLTWATLPIAVSGLKWSALNFTSSSPSSWWALEIEGSSTLDASTFTLNFWIQPDSIASNSLGYGSHIIKIFAQNGTDNESLVTFQWDNPVVEQGTQQCKVFLSNGLFKNTRIESIIDVSIWNNISCVFDGERLFAYLNWQLESSTLVSWFLYNGGAWLVMWAWWPWPGSPVHYYNGKIDEVTLYKKALTRKEIEILYNATK